MGCRAHQCPQWRNLFSWSTQRWWQSSLAQREESIIDFRCHSFFSISRKDESNNLFEALLQHVTSRWETSELRSDASSASSFRNQRSVIMHTMDHSNRRNETCALSRWKILNEFSRCIDWHEWTDSAYLKTSGSMDSSLPSMFTVQSIID